ncbi:HAD family phosphatase [candidate division KSB1 bacterium]|nr:HAD family phosphatase [candidate division KSB1 bacterium]
MWPQKIRVLLSLYTTIPVLNGHWARCVLIRKKYILFDHDGVLVDTEKWYFEATRIILKGIGINLSKKLYLDMQAHGESAMVLVKKAGYTDEDVEKFRQLRNRLYYEYLANKKIEIPGVEDVLTALVSKVRMAIVTTSTWENFNFIHRNRSIVNYMDFILALGDYERTKPHPDPYLAALEKFGAMAQEAIVVEDSERGLRSAVAAGIDCYIVKNNFTAGQDFSAAKGVLQDLRDLVGVINEQM